LDAQNNFYGISNIAGIYKITKMDFWKKEKRAGTAGLSQAGPSPAACLGLA
jgi:hypothetical protein